MLIKLSLFRLYSTKQLKQSRINYKITTLAEFKREALVKGNIIITLSKKAKQNKTKQFQVVKIFAPFSPDLL